MVLAVAHPNPWSSASFPFPFASALFYVFSQQLQLQVLQVLQVSSSAAHLVSACLAGRDLTSNNLLQSPAAGQGLSCLGYSDAIYLGGQFPLAPSPVLPSCVDYGDQKELLNPAVVM